ncbi:YrhK family protein [Halobium palmae]|uniref:YrhK family protein n=1 Tax=Halobium palmae TaxID=1776492 RepID=A0ABD5RYR5_9EURY
MTQLPIGALARVPRPGSGHTGRRPERLFGSRASFEPAPSPGPTRRVGAGAIGELPEIMPENAHQRNEPSHGDESALSVFVQEYEWIHLSLGILGNVLFFVGSVLFLFDSVTRLDIYTFIVGSFLMLVGAVGKALVRYVEKS